MKKMQATPRTADGQNLPLKLSLAFSRAADNARISFLFDAAVKSAIDPKNFVVKRDKAVFDAVIDRGGAAFFHDTATGEVHTLTMSYHVRDKISGDHLHSEIGTSLTRLAGFKSAQAVVAALTLKEWWDSPPSGLIVTEILPSNSRSLGLYRDTLEWEPITDHATVENLHRLCNEYIDPADKGRQTIWFACTDSVLSKMARILLYQADRGSLTGSFGGVIDLDLNALHAIGLTRPVLESIAQGTVDKAALPRQHEAPAPEPLIDTLGFAYAT